MQRLRVLSPVLLIAAVAASCDEQGVPERSDAGHPVDDAADAGGDASADVTSDVTADDGAWSACAAEQAALMTFVQANKSCVTDTDCVFVAAESPWNESCGPVYAGVLYVNASHDQAEMGKLIAALDACLPKLSPCNMSPFPPVCWHGQCTGYIDIAPKTQCLTDLGGESACTKCACGPCNPSCDGILARPVIQCAMKAGCLGTPACDPGSPDFPCKDAMAETGGGQYVYCNECIGAWQCSAVCAQ